MAFGCQMYSAGAKLASWEEHVGRPPLASEPAVAEELSSSREPPKQAGRGVFDKWVVWGIAVLSIAVTALRLRGDPCGHGRGPGAAREPAQCEDRLVKEWICGKTSSTGVPWLFWAYLGVSASLPEHPRSAIKDRMSDSFRRDRLSEMLGRAVSR
jgi:hypothetical protein